MGTNLLDVSKISSQLPPLGGVGASDMIDIDTTGCHLFLLSEKKTFLFHPSKTIHQVGENFRSEIASHSLWQSFKELAFSLLRNISDLKDIIKVSFLNIPTWISPYTPICRAPSVCLVTATIDLYHLLSIALESTSFSSGRKKSCQINKIWNITCQLTRLDRFSTITRKSVRVGGPYLSNQTGRSRPPPSRRSPPRPPPSRRSRPEKR